jgi:hypothetical protein
MFERVALSGLLISVAFGCKEQADMPATYPAKGKVVFKDGKPMSGGVVQFQAEKDEGITVVGETDDNGNFSLQTLKGNRKKVGAMQGTYRVIILPPQSDDHQIAPPIEIGETYTIAAKENVIPTFTVDRPRPSKGTTP